ncbi:MAG: transglycosylase SLT domain-containing protein [Polyangiales bacterium]
MNPLRALLALLPLALLTCTRSHPRPATGLDARSSHPRAADASVDAPGDADAPAPAPSLDEAIAAVRRNDFRAARDALRRLPDDVQRSREGRYLAGRAALELDDFAAAADAFDGLDALVPALATDIRRHRAQALGRAGRHAEARDLYDAIATSAGGGSRDRSLAALEALAAGDTARAARAMRSWASDPPSGVDRARAWRQCAQALEAVGEPMVAVDCWRRIAVDEPDSGHAAAALEALRRLHAPLTPLQSLARAAELIERARYQDALATLTPLAPGRGAFEARRLHLLGRTYYGMRGHYAEASSWLGQAAAHADNADRDEDAFLAARSLSRADRDDDAIRAYDAVARTRAGRWADEAAFRAAWLTAHHDRVDDAVARFQTYLQARPDAPERQRVEAYWHWGWALYRAGRYAEAATPLDRSGSLATHHLERGRGRYWAALARARGGDEATALAAWRSLAADLPLTWYALLAESRLRERGAEVAALAEPPPRRPAVPVEVPSKARWLAALGFDHEAGAAMHADEDRLRRGLPSNRADEALAQAYLSIGEARRAFILSSRHADALDPLPTTDTRWVWDCGFPRPHAPLVEAAEDANGMPRHYLFAIMRQESGFNARDVSNARAIGLLQMVPPTTRRVAESLHLEYREEMLFDPAYNIRVGGWYIGRLYRQYHGVVPRAAGSFNAGPGAMNRWVQGFGGEDLDVFVERIPFDETRNYVRRVTQNLARYRYLYGPRDEGGAPLRVPLRAEEPVDALVDY